MLRAACLGDNWSLKDQRPLSPMGAPQWSVPLVSYTKVKGQVEGAACPEGTRQRPRQHLPGSESLALTCSHPDTLIHIHATHHAYTHTDTHTGVQASLMYKDQPPQEAPTSQCALVSTVSPTARWFPQFAQN